MPGVLLFDGACAHLVALLCTGWRFPDDCSGHCSAKVPQWVCCTCHVAGAIAAYFGLMIGMPAHCMNAAWYCTLSYIAMRKGVAAGWRLLAATCDAGNYTMLEHLATHVCGSASLRGHQCTVPYAIGRL
jgi:hypothetical protein